MRFFTSVNSHVDGQSRTLDELFATTRMLTDVGSDTTVYPFYVEIVSLQDLKGACALVHTVPR
jgi:hypothetical protein